MDVAHGNPWVPFKSKNFSIIWGGTVLSTIGLRMHEVGAGWLMTTLSTDPFIIALVQTATTLPIFLFALVAGAIADVVSKRKMLLVVNILMAVVAVLLAVLVHLQLITPLLLLVFIFLIGVGSAFTAPAKQAINPLLVPRDSLQSAIALNSVGFNLSRSIGPAVAGLLIVNVGIDSPFIFNALSFLVIIAAFLWWRPIKAKEPLPKEPIPGAIKTGLRYARYSCALGATLWRAFAFFISVSAFWALLPLFVKAELQGGASLFGLLVGAIGVGAVIGAMVMPRLKNTMNPNQLVLLASLLIMAIFVLSALLLIKVLAVIASVLFGACWIWTLSTFNTSAQMALPDWVRARGLSIYLMVFFGSMSLGSVAWGYLAGEVGICNTLYVAAITLGLGTLLTQKFKLNQGEFVDLTPSGHWAEPVVVVNCDSEKEQLNDRSPVMVTIEYHIDKADEKEFLSLMCKLGYARRQNGAYSWEILEESDSPGTFIECFMDVSWLEHLRHHQRVTGKDRVLQQQIRTFHQGEESPKIRHFFGSLSQK